MPVPTRARMLAFRLELTLELALMPVPMPVQMLAFRLELTLELAPKLVLTQALPPKLPLLAKPSLMPHLANLPPLPTPRTPAQKLPPPARPKLTPRLATLPLPLTAVMRAPLLAERPLLLTRSRV